MRMLEVDYGCSDLISVEGIMMVVYSSFRFSRSGVGKGLRIWPVGSEVGPLKDHCHPLPL